MSEKVARLFERIYNHQATIPIMLVILVCVSIIVLIQNNHISFEKYKRAAVAPQSDAVPLEATSYDYGRNIEEDLRQAQQRLAYAEKLIVVLNALTTDLAAKSGRSVTYARLLHIFNLGEYTTPLDTSVDMFTDFKEVNMTARTRVYGELFGDGPDGLMRALTVIRPLVKIVVSDYRLRQFIDLKPLAAAHVDWAVAGLIFRDWYNVCKQGSKTTEGCKAIYVDGAKLFGVTEELSRWQWAYIGSFSRVYQNARKNGDAAKMMRIGEDAVLAEFEARNM